MTDVLPVRVPGPWLLAVTSLLLAAILAVLNPWSMGQLDALPGTVAGMLIGCAALRAVAGKVAVARLAQGTLGMLLGFLLDVERAEPTGLASLCAQQTGLAHGLLLHLKTMPFTSLGMLGVVLGAMMLESRARTGGLRRSEWMVQVLCVSGMLFGMTAGIIALLHGPREGQTGALTLLGAMGVGMVLGMVVSELLCCVARGAPER